MYVYTHGAFIEIEKRGRFGFTKS